MGTYYPKALFESGKLSWTPVLSLWPKAEYNGSLLNGEEHKGRENLQLLLGLADNHSMLNQ